MYHVGLVFAPDAAVPAHTAKHTEPHFGTERRGMVSERDFPDLVQEANQMLCSGHLISFSITRVRVGDILFEAFRIPARVIQKAHYQAVMLLGKSPGDTRIQGKYIGRGNVAEVASISARDLPEPLKNSEIFGKALASRSDAGICGLPIIPDEKFDPSLPSLQQVSFVYVIFIAGSREAEKPRVYVGECQSFRRWAPITAKNGIHSHIRDVMRVLQGAVQQKLQGSDLHQEMARALVRRLGAAATPANAKEQIGRAGVWLLILEEAPNKERRLMREDHWAIQLGAYNPATGFNKNRTTALRCGCKACKTLLGQPETEIELAQPMQPPHTPKKAVADGSSPIATPSPSTARSTTPASTPGSSAMGSPLSASSAESTPKKSPGLPPKTLFRDEEAHEIDHIRLRALYQKHWTGAQKKFCKDYGNINAGNFSGWLNEKHGREQDPASGAAVLRWAKEKGLL